MLWPAYKLRVYWHLTWQPCPQGAIFLSLRTETELAMSASQLTTQGQGPMLSSTWTNTEHKWTLSIHPWYRTLHGIDIGKMAWQLRLDYNDGFIKLFGVSITHRPLFRKYIDMMNFILQRSMQELLESSGFKHVIDFLLLSPASLLPTSRQNKLKSA